MKAAPAFLVERKGLHSLLFSHVLASDARGIPSIADSSSKNSVKIAAELLRQIGQSGVAARKAGQSAGNEFEDLIAGYLRTTFQKLTHLRPGRWEIRRSSGRAASSIAEFEQYSHLLDVRKAIRLLRKDHPGVAAALASDYTISPDVIVLRLPEPDSVINSPEVLVDGTVAKLTSFREANEPRPFLHASISCKWTLRSDRAQNARTEALNLIRNRKGRLPHVVVVTGEPLPSRLASLALGTGDVDCVYHFALPELLASVRTLDLEDQGEVLESMVNGKRLKDISDLPLDIAV